MHRAVIVVGGEGLEIVTVRGADVLRFDEVGAIVAYKVAELATDLLCCDVITGAGLDEHVRTIDEDMPGFDAPMTRLETVQPSI
jgi:hypothetical protein